MVPWEKDCERKGWARGYREGFWRGVVAGGTIMLVPVVLAFFLVGVQL